MTIIAILVLLVAGVIAFLNMQLISLNLYFITVSLPLWLLIVVALLVGMLAAILFAGATSAASRKNVNAKEHELQEKLDRKDTELEAAKQETKEVAERTRSEMERDLKMKQKDEEIRSLQRHLDLMEEKMQIQKENIRTDHEDEVVLIPNPTSTPSDAQIITDEAGYPEQSGMDTDDKQNVDPTNRI